MTNILDPLATLPPELHALIQQGKQELDAARRAEELQRQREHQEEQLAAEKHWRALQAAVRQALPSAVHDFVNTRGSWGLAWERGAANPWSSSVNDFIVAIDAPGCAPVECRFCILKNGWGLYRFSHNMAHDEPFRVPEYCIVGPREDGAVFQVGHVDDPSEYIWADSLHVALALAQDEYARRNELMQKCAEKNEKHAIDIKASAALVEKIEAERQTPEGRLLKALKAVIRDGCVEFRDEF